MIAANMTIPTPPAGDPASAGRPGGQLTRPKFFAGQVLTEADLERLTDWAKDRFAIVDRRRGWGIVEGLELTFSADGRHLILHRGTAITSSGQLIFVAADTSVSVSDLCPPDGAAASTEQTFAHIPINDDEYRHYVAELVPDEIDQEFVPIEGRPTHLSQRGTTQARRVVESYKLVLVAPPDIPPVIDPIIWAENFNRLADPNVPLPDPDSRENLNILRNWLEDQLRKTPDPLLMQYLTVLKRDDAEQPFHQLWSIVNLYLVQQRRLAAILETRAAAIDGAGVSLGRVWIASKDVGSAIERRGLAVDLSRDRRGFAADQLPAPSGRINLAPITHMTPNRARRWLRDRGLVVENETGFELADTASNTISRMNGDLWAYPGDRLILQSFDFGAMGLGALVIKADVLDSSNLLGRLGALERRTDDLEVTTQKNETDISGLRADLSALQRSTGLQMVLLVLLAALVIAYILAQL